MPKHDFVDCGRRALLGAGGALILSATLLPARSFAQPSGGTNRASASSARATSAARSADYGLRRGIR